MIKTLAAALLLSALAGAPARAATLGDDGLHKEDWFSVTFRDVKEDIEAANADGKRLVLIFEQRGCIYCKDMHEKILSDPQVRDFIKANFNVVQYNLVGDEEVIDTDGEELTEKSAARKWRVVYTPTVLFLPEAVPEGSVSEAAVATIPGAFPKDAFLDMFVWVRAKGYEGAEGFQAYHARRNGERQAAGKAGGG